MKSANSFMKKIKDAYYHGVYALSRPIAGWLVHKYGFSAPELPAVDGPFIVMSNHTTESDMLMVIASFKRHVYFVCSEHLFRRGIVSKLLKMFYDPIPLLKGSVASTSVREILSRLARGNNIAIFPEGSRTFDGITNPIPASTGKLVKTARCPLVTFHIRGGFFVAPRWTPFYRVGPVECTIRHVYSRDELAGMTAGQINQAIEKDLYENAYEEQLKNPQKYVGEKLAEHIENFLYICPKCGSFHTIKSEGDVFFCSCGMRGRYDEYGMLSGEGLPFKTLPEWEAWQNERFDERYALAADDDILFEEENVCLTEITKDHKTIPVFTGKMTTTKSAFSIGPYTIGYEDLQGSELLNLGNTFLFYWNDRSWDLTARTLCAEKYRKLHAKYLQSIHKTLAK